MGLDCLSPGWSFFDKHTDNRVTQWADAAWIIVTPGEVIDYDISGDIAEDCASLRVADISYDEWSGEPARQAIGRRTNTTVYPVAHTYKGTTHGTTELMTSTRSRAW